MARGLDERRFVAMRRSVNLSHIPVLFKTKRSKAMPKSELRKNAAEFLENYDIALGARHATIPHGEIETGDYVWLHLGRGKGQGSIGIGDITSHGTKAAALRRRIVKAIAPMYAGTKTPPLQKVSDKLHALIERESDVLPAIHGKFDWRNGVIRYFNAGHHTPVLLLREGKVLEVMPPTQTLLGVEREKVEPKEIKLREGDRIFFVTDGIFEHSKQNAEMPYQDRLIPRERILEAIKKHAGKPLNEHVQEIFKTLDAWEKERLDDQTIFALEVKKKIAAAKSAGR